MTTKILLGILVFVLSSFMVGAIDIGAGTYFGTENVTWNFTQDTTLDNFTIRNYSVQFNNDNISFIPNASSTISINSWVNTTSHSFTINEAPRLVPYSIDVSGRPGVVYYGSLYYFTPLNFSAATTFSYLVTSNVTFTIRDEITQDIITWATHGTNITLELIADEGTYTLNTSTGIINDNVALNDYNIRMSADGYSDRYYQAEIDNLSESFTLYLLNTSQTSNVTITVYDENGNEVSGATVKALRYYVGTNTYELEESSVTNDDGAVTMALQLNSEYYKFMVVYDGETVKTTTPVILTTTSISININLGASVGDVYDRFRTIDYSLVYNDATNNFRFTWNDLNDDISQVCLKTYYLRANSKTLTNTSCSASTAGTILLPITPTNGTAYMAQASYTETTGSYILDTLTKTFKSGSGTGGLGLLIQFIFTALVALVGFWSLPVMVALTPLTLIIGQTIGLNNFPLEVIIPLQIAGFILAFMWRGKS